MRKIQILALALFATFAFSAIAASMAFAEDEWLVDGASVLAGEKVPVHTEGELLLTDLKVPILGEAQILCSGIAHGFVEAKGKDEVTEILSLGGEGVSNVVLAGKPLLCTNELNCPEAEVWPVGMPWLTQLELEGTTFLDDTTSAGGSVGYEAVCHEGGIIGTQVDTCTQPLVLATLTNMLEAGEEDVLALINSQGLGNCTLGGTGAGDIESHNAIGALIATLSGLKLEVSGT